MVILFGYKNTYSGGLICVVVKSYLLSQSSKVYDLGLQTPPQTPASSNSVMDGNMSSPQIRDFFFSLSPNPLLKIDKHVNGKTHTYKLCTNKDTPVVSTKN